MVRLDPTGSDYITYSAAKKRLYDWLICCETDTLGFVQEMSLGIRIGNAPITAEDLFIRQIDMLGGSVEGYSEE